MTITEVCNLLRANDNFEILTHASPDGDTLGCGHALCLALQQIGKNARVICESVPEKFAYLKKGIKQQEFIGEYIVSTDIAADSLLGEHGKKYEGKIDLCIDHHKSNSVSAKNKYVDPDSAAACEIIYEVVKGLGAEISTDIANCLYTGTATDTGCFKFSNTTAKTHRIAADLIEAGCDFNGINKAMFDTKTKARMALEHALYDTMEYFSGGKGAVICVSLEMMKKLNITSDDIEGVEAIPRAIEGVEMGITVKEKEGGFCKISVRTNGELDASHFCAEFGGGGHFAAAGCSIDGDCQKVKKTIIKAAEEFI